MMETDHRNLTSLIMASKMDVRVVSDMSVTKKEKMAYEDEQDNNRFRSY
jgi:hypothetical protein